MFKKSFTKMLICDMAGTIIHENGIVYKTLFNTIRKFKPNIKMTQIEDFHGYKKTEVIKHFLYDDCKMKDPSLLRKMNKHFNTNLKYDYLNSDIKLIHPDLCKYFNELRKDNIKIALNTGYNKEIQDILIYKLNLKYCIDDSISSYTASTFGMICDSNSSPLLVKLIIIMRRSISEIVLTTRSF